MQIGKELQNLINNYIQGNTKSSTNEIKPALKNVKVGEELKVQLLKIMSNTSLVELVDGSEMVISGKLPKEADIGMILNIKVKSKSDGLPIMAEIVSIENPENSKIEEIKKDFKNLKIPMTKENLEVTREMIKGNIEINEQNINHTFKMLNEFRNVGIKNLIFMLKNDIKITKESTDSFLGMINKNDFIESNLNNIIDVLSNEIEKIESKNNQILEVVQGKNSEVSNTNENVQVSDKPIDMKVDLEHNTVINVDNLPDKPENNNGINSETEVLNLEQNKVVVNNLNPEKIEKINEYLDASEMIIPNVEDNEESIKTNDINIKIDDTNKSSQEENVKVKQELPKVNDDIPLEKDSFFKEEKLKMLKREVIDLFELVDNKDNFKNEIKGKKIINKIIEFVNEVEKEIEKLPEELKTSITKETSRVKQNVELLNDLNKYNTVLQIPLNVNDNRTMAELYIFNGDKESSNRKINESNYTMFLSLGTANIGQIEAYVKVVNKTVECNFMATNNLGVTNIKEDADKLIKLLDVYGYQLIKLDVKEFNKDRLNIFEAIDRNKDEENKFKFDMKV